jgi:hypothetical protein
MRALRRALVGEDLGGASAVPTAGGSATHINGDQVDLGMTVLAGFGGRHVDNLLATMSSSATKPAVAGVLTLQGRPLMTTWPFLRRAEHCMG